MQPLAQALDREYVPSSGCMRGQHRAQCETNEPRLVAVGENLHAMRKAIRAAIGRQLGRQTGRPSRHLG